MIDYCLFAYHNSRIYQWTENEDFCYTKRNDGVGFAFLRSTREVKENIKHQNRSIKDFI